MDSSYIKTLVSNNNFKIIKANVKNIKKFNVSTSNYQVVFKNIPSEFIDSIFYMNEIMQLLISKIR